MTQTRRIIFNVLATYGRSLLCMFCGLFTSRWVLQALGTEAYGVFGVVGTIIGMVTIVNSLLSTSVSRYYAYAYGQVMAATDKSKAIENCQRWFNVALFVHLVLPVSASIIGLFVGAYAIDHWFVIPERYLATSHWVFYFALLMVTVGVLNVPFRSMFVAKQMIAELTIFDITVPILNIGCAWWLLRYSGNRLFFNALYTMLLSIIPNVLIAWRALCVFPECRIDRTMMMDWGRIKRIFSFAGWQFVAYVAYICTTQGIAAIVNRLLGIRYNATMTTAGSVSGHTATLSNALTGAFIPAVTNAAGSGDRNLMFNLALRSCKFGTLLSALVAIPLAVEIHCVIRLWLTTIPPEVDIMCLVLLFNLVIDKMSGGALAAILATGDIKVHELWNAVCFLSGLVSAFCFVKYANLGIIGIGLGYLVNVLTAAILKMTLWKKQLHFPLLPWFRFSLTTISIAAITVGAGVGITRFMPPSLTRVLINTLVITSVFFALSWSCVMDRSERDFVVTRVRSKWRTKYA